MHRGTFVEGVVSKEFINWCSSVWIFDAGRYVGTVLGDILRSHAGGVVGVDDTGKIVLLVGVHARLSFIAVSRRWLQAATCRAWTPRKIRLTLLKRRANTVRRTSMFMIRLAILSG
jgi:hypothetical protein